MEWDDTDNMSILGLTNRYGTYGMAGSYDEGWTPNTTETTTISGPIWANQINYRAYGNLYKLANALFTN